MKTYKVTYSNYKGLIRFELVKARSNKLNKRIQNYFFHINADIISVEQI